MEKKRFILMALCLILTIPTVVAKGADVPVVQQSDRRITMSFNKESLPAALNRLEKENL